MRIRILSDGILLFSGVLLTAPLLRASAQDVDVLGNLTMHDSADPTVGNILKEGVTASSGPFPVRVVAQEQEQSAGADFRAGHRCSNRTLRGSYGFTGSGFVVSPPFPPELAGPFAAAGVFSFDGDGTVSALDTVSFNGRLRRRVITGNYIVEEDCRGSITDVDDLGNVRTIDLVIVENGNEVRIINTLPGTAITAVLRRQ